MSLNLWFIWICTEGWLNLIHRWKILDLSIWIWTQQIANSILSILLKMSLNLWLMYRLCNLNAKDNFYIVSVVITCLLPLFRCQNTEFHALIWIHASSACTIIVNVTPLLHSSQLRSIKMLWKNQLVPVFFQSMTQRANSEKNLNAPLSTSLRGQGSRRPSAQPSNNGRIFWLRVSRRLSQI